MSLYRHLREHEAQRRDAPLLPDRFEQVSSLGEGGMGIVYRARDRELDRWVAIKALRGPASTGRRRRFEGEAKALAKVRHANVVLVHELIDRDGSLLVVMDWIEGRSLATILRDGVLPPTRVAEIGRDVARGLAAAHAAGVLHRDLKPGNVLVHDGDGRACLVDFGLARRLDASEVLTRVGQLVGTPAYLPPEQARDSRDADARSDVYGLGATLYAALTGTPPIRGDSLVELLERLTDPEEVADPRSVRPEIPEELAQIVCRALRKDPDRRFPSALELSSALQRFLARDGAPRPSESLAIGGILAVSGALVALSVSALLWFSVPATALRTRPRPARPLSAEATPSPPQPRAPLAPQTLAHRGARRVAFVGGGGRHLLSATARELRLWRMDPEAPSVRWARELAVDWALPSPDAQRIAMGAGTAVLVVGLDGRTRAKHELPAPTRTSVGCWTAGGGLIVAGADGGGIYSIGADGRVDTLRRLEHDVVTLAWDDERGALIWAEGKARTAERGFVPYRLLYESLGARSGAVTPRAWVLSFRPTALVRGRGPTEWILGMQRGTLHTLDVSGPAPGTDAPLDPTGALVAPKSSFPEAFEQFGTLAPLAHTSAVDGAGMLSESVLVTVAGPRPMAGGDVRLWDLNRRSLLGVAIDAAQGPFHGLAVSDDRRSVALLVDRGVRIVSSAWLIARARDWRR